MAVPFTPAADSTVNIDVSSSSQRVQVSAAGCGCQVRVMNNGTATVWIKFGTDNTITADTTNDMPVGPGVTEVLTKNNGPIYVAAIAAASTGKIYFTPGSGI